MSPEHTVARTYLEWLISLPWAVSSGEAVNVQRAAEILDEDHYDLEKVKNRILDFLAVMQLKPKLKGPILCFVGPPGVGKTSLGRSIARSLGRKFQRISLGGMHDEAEIRGHRRTYIGSMPGQVIQALRRAGANDPVFVLDEVDKLGRDFRGDPSSALLEVLDPEQNSTFRDNYLDVPFDLSRVLFITTANVLDTIPGPLRDRMEVIELQGYTEQEKVTIAFRYLIPRQKTENGLEEKPLVFLDDAVQFIVRRYTREAGVRNLEREIGTVCRKVARRYAEGAEAVVEVTRAMVEESLGAPRYRPDTEVAERTRRPGVAVGLAWTPVGGDVLFIEAGRMPGGNKGLIMTGQLGSVMQESVQAALTWVRANATKYGVDPDVFKTSDIHVHVPAGAIPKDGPSAGVTMATALLSMLTDKCVKENLAMTGEITLTGQVLPIGGIKEKVLAAKRSGVTDIILPAENEVNVREDLKAEQIGDIRMHYVKTMDELVPIALGVPFKVVRGVKVFHLITEEVDHEFAPGLRAYCWGFNGQVHGPTIEVVEGDRVRIYVTNNLPENTSIHWHGVFLLCPPAWTEWGDLARRLSNPARPTSTSLKLRQQGTCMYLSHCDEMTQNGGARDDGDVYCSPT